LPVEPKHFCVQCGSPLVVRVIEGREHEACPNDDFVLWRDPKVAAAVVVEVAGGLLLGRRAIEPGYGQWCLPGGFVNDDEDPADAAARECMEEIGARIEAAELLEVYHVGKRTAPSIVGIAFRARLAAGETPTAGSEMLELGVFRPDALPEIAFPSHRQVLAHYVARAHAPASRPSEGPGRPSPPRTP
jgi:ADP-ribose pyrophosphatase YjhB (NUDIX family)